MDKLRPKKAGEFRKNSESGWWDAGESASRWVVVMRFGVALVAGVVAAACAACQSGPLAASPGASASSASEPSASRGATQPAAVFGGAGFAHPLRIDNYWTPMLPGTASYYAGTVAAGSTHQGHGIISIVTDLTKVIDGIRARVVWERDFSNGVLAESELFFVAQDDTGTVWLFGEYPAVYEHGTFRGAPDTWISGVDGAQPGIFMRSKPTPGTASYSQGRAPSVQFYDRAQVSRAGLHACSTFGCYSNVLVISEWSPLAPSDGHQLKFYAPRLGTVLVLPAGGSQQESLSLVNIVHLSTSELANVRRQVLAIDAGGYRVSRAYRHTPRAAR